MPDINDSNPYKNKTLITRKTQRETGILPDDLPQLRRNPPQPDVNGSTATLGEQRELILVIRGMIERLVVKENNEFMLGRFEPAARKTNEVDLTPYGAMDRGVSRLHAKIHLQDNHLYITDLGSTNGTVLGGVKLEPDKPTLLRKGDELMVGRLAIQVLFR
jgi:hypothetical protein